MSRGCVAFAGLAEPDRIALLRTRPGLTAAVLAAAGDEALTLLAAVWVQLARHHTDDPDVQGRLLAKLRVLDRLEALARSDREAALESFAEIPD